MRHSSLDRRDFLRMLPATALVAGGAGRLVADEPLKETVAPIGARMAALEESAPLAMQFRGKTAADARRWQAEFAAKLRELLGPHRPPAKWDCVLEKRVDLP